MLSDKQFISTIEVTTGKIMVNGDFGFIAGTHHPLREVKGMQSASLCAGFEVWTYDSDGMPIQKQLNPSSQQESLDQIISFLKTGK